MVVYSKSAVVWGNMRFPAYQTVVVRKYHGYRPYTFEEGLNFIWSYVIGGLMKTKNETYQLAIF